MADDNEVWKHVGELHKKMAELHVMVHEKTAAHGPESELLSKALSEHAQAMKEHTAAMHEHAKLLSEVHAHGRPHGD